MDAKARKKVSVIFLFLFFVRRRASIGKYLFVAFYLALGDKIKPVEYIILCQKWKLLTSLERISSVTLENFYKPILLGHHQIIQEILLVPSPKTLENFYKMMLDHPIQELQLLGKFNQILLQGQMPGFRIYEIYQVYLNTYVNVVLVILS